MSLRIQDLKEGEWILIHDFYSESPEPDAPKAKFESLSKEEKEQAALQYSSTQFKSVIEGNTLIGFLGFFPDDEYDVNIFCVISPQYRGKGYFPKILNLSLEYCRREFSGYKHIRGLTRKENTPSIKGLEKALFKRKGTVIEAVQSDIVYEEYILPIT